ncbi:sulfurtransferase TusA family protein [Brucellaceae bacterium C25G]
MSENERVVIYDLRGLNCPLPVLKTRRKLKDMASGDLLDVCTTDPMSRIDIPHFCNSEGHTIIDQYNDGVAFTFRIKKA